jgi:hypothetical protein
VYYNYAPTEDNARKVEVAVPRVTPLRDGSGAVAVEVWQPRGDKDSMKEGFKRCVRAWG